MVNRSRRPGNATTEPNCGAEGEIVPPEPQLFKQLRKRAGASAWGGVIRDRMQADIVVAAAQSVEGVEAANRCVAFKNADRFFVIGQPDPGGQSRHSCADDDGVVAHGE